MSKIISQVKAFNKMGSYYLQIAPLFIVLKQSRLNGGSYGNLA